MPACVVAGLLSLLRGAVHGDLIRAAARRVAQEANNAAARSAASTTLMVFRASAVVDGNSCMHTLWRLCCRFLKRKAQCMAELGGNCEMGGFTRILHTGKPDDLVDQIPTFVAKPLRDPRWPEVPARYGQLNRPYAIWQWLNSTNIAEDFILLSEPDHIFLHPLPNLVGPSMRPVAPQSSIIEFNVSARPSVATSAGRLSSYRHTPSSKARLLSVATCCSTSHSYCSCSCCPLPPPLRKRLCPCSPHTCRPSA